MTLTVGSLFSGIGGFDLGLERAGMRVIWQSEIDPYASAVLRKHWPHVPNHGDIRTITAGTVERPDVLCGGFPCQDISNAGKRAGIDGDRSGLWSEYARVIGELRPRYVLVENVAALLGRGLERVLGDLAALGFDAEWHCIPASAVGAPHLRDRIWIVAESTSADAGGRSEQQQSEEFADGIAAQFLSDPCGSGVADQSDNVAHAERQSIYRMLNGGGGERSSETPSAGTLDAGNSNGGAPMADAECWRLQGGDEQCAGPSAIVASALSRYRGGREFGQAWRIEPDVGRVAYGIPAAVDRLRCIGNAIVPQVAEVIGRAIVESMETA